MIKHVLEVVLIIYSLTGFCFEPFNAVENPDLKKRIDIRRAMFNEQQDLQKFASNRYGDFGPTALSKLKNLCENFDALIVFSGLVFAIEDFEEFFKQHKLECGDPWEAAKLFSDFFGKKTVYRAINLNEEEFVNIQKNGIQSEALRQNADLRPYDDFSVPMEFFKRARPDLLQLRPKLLDRTLSLSSDPEISRTVSFGFARPDDVGKRDMYLFKVEIPNIENLVIEDRNIRFCDYAERNNEIFPPVFVTDIRTARMALCTSSFFPPLVESFAEFVIEPDEIKEFEKVPLTNDNIAEAKQKLNSILQKQSCDEIKPLKSILNTTTYRSVKRTCRNNK